MKPIALIVRGAGINCDQELAFAFERAGAQSRAVHLNELIRQPRIIEEADLIGFPGGFSYGDDIAAGRIFANRVRHHLSAPLLAAVQRGTPVIGICNGFQILVKLGLLPDPPDMMEGRQSATLADNTSGRFIDRWVSLVVAPKTVCIWTQGLEALDLPIAHGEGRFVPGSDAALQRWRERGQIALRYAPTGDALSSHSQPVFPGNPNGSVDDIAGVCDPSGVVLGLMPHPERHVHPTHHPLWTRQPADAVQQTPPGLRMFQSAVEFVRNRKRAAEPAAV
jgi:phosphoribosylformylglycinamidine synthase I